ncbi:hypothetical protein BX285_4118 [Streptomyces sp. 1114.5]|uniref:hypothetical protein n=1 Tax=unclassified Streptomyces TaxID=2593676 RepID=UPI000BC9F8AC|nr:MULTISPECIES: hypothetical protein [unclassified Streptomyces]RKT19649.1 hypothetical protein BX285_4118 [Streptomyces sp. 1114.5]SOB85846.1 hypothetical protein SAMN06272789_6147 [Streptomyces sp. 1331.2]
MSAVPNEAPHDDILRLHVIAEDRETLRTLLHETRPDVGGRPHVEADGRIGIDVYAPASEIPALEREGVTVTRTGNASEAGRAAQAEVGTGDRFAAADAVPHGLAAKLAG